MGVWFSCLTHTSAPMRLASNGQAYWGVGGTTLRTRGTAASSSAKLKSGMGLALLLQNRLAALRVRSQAFAASRGRRGSASRARQLDQVLDRLAAPEALEVGEHEGHLSDERRRGYRPKCVG